MNNQIQKQIFRNIMSFGPLIAGLWAITHLGSISTSVLSVIFLVSATCSWFDFGLAKKFQLEELGGKKLSFVILITLILITIFLIFIHAFCVPYSIFVYICAGLASWLMLLLRGYCENRGVVVYYNVILNLSTGVALILDACFFHGIYIYLLRFIFPLIFFWLVYSRPLILSVSKELETGEAAFSVAMMQVMQLIPANAERLFVIFAGDVQGSLVFIAEMINRFVPVAGQVINALFYDFQIGSVVRVSVQQVLLLASVSCALLFTFFQDDLFVIFVSIMILISACFTIPSFLENFYSGKISALAISYAGQSILVLVIVLFTSFSLVALSFCKMMYDWQAQLTIKRLF